MSTHNNPGKPTQEIAQLAEAFRASKATSPDAIIVLPGEEGPGVQGIIARIPGYVIRITSYSPDDGSKLVTHEGMVVTSGWETITLSLVDVDGNTIRVDEEDEDRLRNAVEVTVPWSSILTLEIY